MPPDENHRPEPIQEEPAGRSLMGELREMLRILIISLVIVLPIRFFVAQPFIVRGASMEPTYHDGEYLIVDELSYRFSEPNRGDVIIFRYPHDPRQFYIKRVIGLPGETVTIRNGTVSVKENGSGESIQLTEGYLRSGASTFPDKVITLKGNEFFVLGDNRSNSSDSRLWGTLPEEYLVGRAFLRLWPPSQLSIL